MDAAAAGDFLATAPLGTRVVVRYRIPGGATDALGDLIARTPSTCTVATRRGDIELPLGDVIAAKPVPPPPIRRARIVPPTL